MSRLEDNSVQTREFLETRNLYTPNDPYNVSGTETINVIGNIANVINPFGTTVTTIVGRLAEGQTPLTAIGLKMLAIQLGYTAASNAAAEYLPAIKFENLFDGNPDTKFIMKKEDFQITRRETQGNVGKILEEVSGNYPLKGNPFTKETNNLDFIRNSGKGQLQLFYKELSKNLYQPSSRPFVDLSNAEGFNYGMNVDVQFNNKYFLGRDEVFNPYNQYKTTADITALNNKLYQERITFINQNQDSSGYLEYGASQIFIDGMGNAELDSNNIDIGLNGQIISTGIYSLDGDDYGLVDDPKQQLVWGRDTDNTSYKDEVGGFDNPVDGIQPSDNGGVESKLDRFGNISEIDKFNIKNGGLLSYTRELLNSKGKNSSFDLTRKKFIDNDEQLHFNGSPLRVRLDGEIDKNRQHTVLDPYNTFVKAIRFNGNKIYNGNENSVVYKNVIPKIHPIIDGNDINNRNMMFSIENLAFEVYPDETMNYGLVQDEKGTELPLCEVGKFGGRLMWFPPYDISVTENVVVNHESTNFIGRGEPIYTYNNTERIANLSFKLLIDYPPQIKGMSHVEANRFFAFGGEAPLQGSNLGDKIRKKEKLIEERESIQPKIKQARPDFIELTNNFFFINDEPKIGGESTSIGDHISRYYEIDKNHDIAAHTSDVDGANFGLNESFIQDIEENITKYLVDEKVREYTELRINGSASVLFLGNDDDYNVRLSRRRINAVVAFIDEKFKTLTGQSLEQAGIKVVIPKTPIGEVGGTATDEISEIASQPAKEARRAFVTFGQNNVTINKEVPITTTDQENIDSLNEEIQVLETNISTQKAKNNANCTYNTYTIEDGVLKGFESSQKNKYKPIFHSQTPEDFHRRLTFLHQCTRQGNAIRKQRGKNNTFSASNSVFGRQPVQILRIGDMFHTKVVIDNLQIDYTDAPWDMNPEGMGMQFMIADIKLQLKLVGGQSLQTPINALQNAVSFNYYANSTFYNTGIYERASEMEKAQMTELFGSKDVDGNEVREVRNNTQEIARKVKQPTSA